MSSARCRSRRCRARALRAADAEPSVSLLPLPFTVEEFRAPAELFRAHADDLAALPRSCPPDRAVVAVWGKAGGAALHLEKGELRQVRWHRRRGAAVARGAAQRRAGNADAERGPADGVPLGAARRLPPRRLRQRRRRRRASIDRREAAARRRQHAAARSADEDRHRRGGAGRGVRGPRAAPCRSRPRRHAGDPRRQILPRQGLGARRRSAGATAPGRVVAETPPVGEPPSLARPGRGRRFSTATASPRSPSCARRTPGRAAALGLGRAASSSLRARGGRLREPRLRRERRRQRRRGRSRRRRPPRARHPDASTASRSPSSRCGAASRSCAASPSRLRPGAALRRSAPARTPTSSPPSRTAGVVVIRP